LRDGALRLPDWPPAPGVFACVTTRLDGCSQSPWDTFNLGSHVGDAAAAVEQNRALLEALLRKHTGLHQVPVQWLQQVHGTGVLSLPCSVLAEPAPEADAIYTQASGIACAVLTADCLPVLFCSDDGGEIAVAHAGWRGLVQGVLEQTLARFQAAPQRIRAWLGPAIAACHFEVGPEVREAFVGSAPASLSDATGQAFQPLAGGKYKADLYALARLRLQQCGVDQVYGEPVCTVCDAQHWYSYRRDGVTGRFATLILRHG
jgi:YfiH family protein